LDSTSNPQLQAQLDELETQFVSTVTKLKKKFGVGKFIVYFQSYTNTYAPLETLKALYEKALGFDDVVGLSIGTRTDCIDDDILAYLKELNIKNEIWVEYGVQSFCDSTLDKINRGHDSASMKFWMKRTKEYGLNVCAHLIYGLPSLENQNEDRATMLNTLYETIDLQVDSIKFHPLYVTDNTILANDYRKGRFEPISEKEYIDILVESIKIMSEKYPNISIQRITAGVDDKSLLSPIWCKDKHRNINIIRAKLRDIGLNY
jgi:radical SAM protein (TIGR01212 family)